MSYAQLKAFHAVALEGSIQKAADRLRLTQPAISIQLKSLETDSGRSLVRRRGHVLQLTEDGQALFEATQRMFRAESDADVILSAPPHQYRGTLVVGADGPHVALDLIARFQIREPAVRIETIFANAEQTWANLLDLKVDCAVLAGSPEDPRVLRQVLARQSLVALVSQAHDLAGAPAVDLRQLCAYPLIFRERGSNTQRKLTHAFLAKKLAVSPALVLGSREAVYEAVVRNMGIGFVFDREAGRDSRVTAVPINGFENANIDELACLKAQRSSPYVDALFACAETMAA